MTYLDQLSRETHASGFNKEEHKYVGIVLGAVSESIYFAARENYVHYTALECDDMAAHFILETNHASASPSSIRAARPLLDVIRERGRDEVLIRSLMRHVFRHCFRVLGGMVNLPDQLIEDFVEECFDTWAHKVRP